MPSEDEVKVVEEYFKKLTGSQDVKYETLYPGIGKGAVKGEIVDDTFWQATLVKQFAKTKSYENVPTGDISSLTYLTQKPADDRKAKAKIITKIYHFGTDVEERIKEAIQAQNLVRELVDKWDVEFRQYNRGLSIDRIRLENVDGTGSSVSITNVNRRGEEPIFPLAITQRFKEGEESFVRALGYADYEIREIIPVVDFQIEKFQGLLKA